MDVEQPLATELIVKDKMQLDCYGELPNIRSY